MKLGSLVTALAVFIEKTATPDAAQTLIPELLKVRPVADLYELHGLQVSAQGRIGGLNVESTYRFSFDGDGYIKMAETLGNSLPEEVKDKVGDIIGGIAMQVASNKPSES